MKRRHERLTANQICVIKPYWLGTVHTWVFDDSRVGLVQEPFVLGIPEMINALVSKNLGDDYPIEQGFRLLFSEDELPQYQEALTKQSEESGGCWYKQSDGQRGWLCAAMFHYFSKTPDMIYLKAERL